ncbi:unnamed protein product [Rotaria socialis]
MSVRKQLKLFDLDFYLDNKKLLFVSDRVSNIKKSLEGQDVLFCFGHRLNNILQKAFYQVKGAPEKKCQAITTATPVSKKRRTSTPESSDGETSSDDDDELYKKNLLHRNIKKQIQTFYRCQQNQKNYLIQFHPQSRSPALTMKFKTNSGVALQQSNITRDLVVLLKTFQDVITLIQHGDRPTLHLVYVGLNKLKRHLSGEDIGNNGDEIIIDDRHEGTDFFRKRLKKLLMLMFQVDKKHSAAALLHPFYRKLTYVNDYQKMKTHIFVRQSITDLYGYGTQQVNKGVSVISEPVKKKHRNIEDQFIDPEEDGEININSSIQTNQTVDELDKYLKMSIPDQYKVQDPLIFLKDHRDKLPYLAKLARRLYSMPATSACVERQYSAGGLLINERRSSLNPDIVEDVLFIRSVQKAVKNNLKLFSG